MYLRVDSKPYASPSSWRTHLSPSQSSQLFCAGRLSLLERPCVAIIGTRTPTVHGRARARRLARELVGAGVTVMSGLAAGIDTAAHMSAINAGGSTVAVIGTPLDKVYPVQNRWLQELIHRQQLLVSPFPSGSSVQRSNFPRRNKVMASLSRATVIIEAAEKSGTRHQADECRRLDRPLFIARSLAENTSLTWPRRLLRSRNVHMLTHTADVLAVLG